MKKESLSYYAFLNPVKSPGVYNKITSTVEAAKKIGIQSSYNFYGNSLLGIYSFYTDLLNSNSDYILIRYVDKVTPILFFILLKLRYNGKIIIIDIPTPRVIGLKEIFLSDRSLLYKITRSSLSVLLGSWWLLPSHKVIQYANESFWFKIGIRNKIIKMGNGTIIDDNIPLIDSHWPDKELRFIGVAQLEPWHGYDRLIKAIASPTVSNLPYKTNFTIVGDGPELNKLKELVKKLSLEDKVTFTGMLIDEDLNKVFNNKHIGVSSLAPFRKGLNEGSELKTREYMSRGLPALGAGSDPDFANQNNLRLQVSNDDSIESIVKFITNLQHSKLPDSKYIRNFAISNLSYENKIKKILGI